MKFKLAFILTASAVFSSYASAAQMSLETYKRLHKESVSVGRCVLGVSKSYALENIYYAYNKGLISWDTVGYSVENKAYPVVTYNSDIGAVCPFD